jgi:hypothetical protein
LHCKCALSAFFTISNRSISALATTGFQAPKSKNLEILSPTFAAGTLMFTDLTA